MLCLSPAAAADCGKRRHSFVTGSLCHFAVSPKSQSFTSLPSKSTFSGLISRWWRSLVGTSLLHTANVDLDTVHE